MMTPRYYENTMRNDTSIKRRRDGLPIKPVLSLTAARLFGEIAAYVRQCCIGSDGEQILKSAASDVMDGRRLDSDPEVKELISKGIIETILIGDGRWNRGYTWHLTDYGIALLRLTNNPKHRRTSMLYGVKCETECPCCGSDLRKEGSITVRMGPNWTIPTRISVGRLANIFFLSWGPHDSPTSLDDDATVECTECREVLQVDFVPEPS